MPKAVGYRLTLPIELYEEISRHALARGETVTDALRRMIKLGLLWDALIDQGHRLLVEDEHGQRELVP